MIDVNTLNDVLSKCTTIVRSSSLLNGSTLFSPLFLVSLLPLIFSATIRNTSISSSKRRGKTHFVVSCSLVPTKDANVQRRYFVLFGVTTSASLLLSFRALGVEVESASDVKMALSVGEIKAYSFLYPLVLPKKNRTFIWI